jgi:hypothetical protein
MNIVTGDVSEQKCFIKVNVTRGNRPRARMERSKLAHRGFESRQECGIMHVS